MNLKLVFKTKYILCVSSFLLFVLFVSVEPEAGVSMGDDLDMGIPLGGGAEEANVELCPQGVRVVAIFLAAWKKEDFQTMYKLLDDESKKNYPFKQARFDFQFLEFKNYKISSIRRQGEDFEFMLSYGDWRDGNKDIKKIVISGKTFKVIMATKNSPFKESIESYF